MDRLAPMRSQSCGSRSIIAGPFLTENRSDAGVRSPCRNREYVMDAKAGKSLPKARNTDVSQQFLVHYAKVSRQLIAGPWLSWLDLRVHNPLSGYCLSLYEFRHFGNGRRRYKASQVYLNRHPLQFPLQSFQVRPQSLSLTMCSV